jgi:hypothetical protein
MPIIRRSPFQPSIVTEPAKSVVEYVANYVLAEVSALQFTKKIPLSDDIDRTLKKLVAVFVDEHMVVLVVVMHERVKIRDPVLGDKGTDNKK